jgi:aldehyde dehydrogenase (NAD+)
MEQPKFDWAKSWLGETKTSYGDGKWLAHGGRTQISVRNPSTTGELTKIAEASASDVDIVVKAASSAFQQSAWRKLTRAARAESLRAIGALIRKHHAELATLESLANGKTWTESWEDDIPESADVFDYYAGWIDKFYGEKSPVADGFLNFTQHEPLGVCVLIVPWNFPLLLACWKIAPALAMGNTVIVKPSPFTPLSMVRLTELIHEAKILPPGVFNLILGDRESGEALTSHNGVAKVSFTGSTAVGKKIVEASAHSNLKRLSLELGGKSANIIFEDAENLDAVVNRSFTAMFSHKAEKCSEPTRFIIHDSVYDRVASALAAKAEAVRCGDPFAAGVTQGPQCHEQHFRKILDYIEIGKKEGAKLLAGGSADPVHSTSGGWWIRPTIFGDVRASMRIAKEEIFGPVLCLLRFKDEQEAIELANSTDYGLAAGFYTANASRALRVSNALDAGMIFVNHYGCYDFAAPFGGFRQSGWGKEMGRVSLEEYTKLKSVWIRYG